MKFLIASILFFTFVVAIIEYNTAKVSDHQNLQQSQNKNKPDSISDNIITTSTSTNQQPIPIQHSTSKTTQTQIEKTTESQTKKNLGSIQSKSNSHQQSINLDFNKHIDPISIVDALFQNSSGELPTYQNRKETLRKLGKNLSTRDRTRIYDFLKSSENDVDTLHIKDELMNILEQAAVPYPEYIDQLIHISSDQSLDGDMRGYVVQHLRSSYVNADDEKRKKIRTTLYNHLEEHTSDVSGTALLAVINLNDRFGEFDNEKIDHASLSISNSKNAHLPSQITALQLSGSRKIEEALPAARNHLKTSDDMVMQVASISAIGNIGDAHDLVTLENILNNPNKKFLHEAANLAKTKIIKKYNP